MKTTTIRVRCRHEWTDVQAVIVSRYFAVHRPAVPIDFTFYGPWLVTHRPTGYVAMHSFSTRDGAILAARRLHKRFGPRWNFTRASKARGLNAKDYVRRLKALFA